MALAPYNPYMGQSVAVKELLRAQVAHFQRTAAENSVADADGILDGTALTAEPQNIKTFTKQPSCAKNLTVVGTAANMVGDVVITGTDINGATITETFALNGTSAQTGDKAFKTVTNIALPALTTEGDTVDVGWGVKLGLPVCLAQNTVIMAYRDTSTADTGTVAVDAADVSKNTYIAGAQAKTLDVWFLIN